MKKTIFITILFTFYLLFTLNKGEGLFTFNIKAQDSKSDSYSLEESTVDVIQPEPSVPPPSPTPTPLSFPIVDSSLTLAISPSAYTFDKISPNTPYIKPVLLSVKTGKNQGFSLTISQDNPPKSNSKLIFPEFKGDSGDCEGIKNPCSWISKSTYGLGFRLELPYTEEFQNPSLFKKIPIVSIGDPKGSLINKTKEGETQSKINLKVNLEKGSLATNWNALISYTVLPTY